MDFSVFITKNTNTDVTVWSLLLRRSEGGKASK